MKPIIVYPMPQDSKEVWEIFQPFILRFLETFTKHPGDCEIALIHCAEHPSGVMSLSQLNAHAAALHSLPCKFSTYAYPDNGCDIGSAQWLSKQLPPEQLMIMMTSRCYFHKDGWLERYLYAHSKDPDALLGASASYEGGKRHICTRAYAMKAGLFAAYPHLIDTRPKGQMFEVGEWCLSDWIAEQGRKLIQVTFDGEQEQAEWRKPDNIYRKGDQSNCLVWDRHTDIWRDADVFEKIRLEEMVRNPAST